MKNEQRLINYLGHERVEAISKSMKDWYGPPIAIAQVPGRIYATAGGDFVGAYHGGFYDDVRDFFIQRCRRIWREWHKRQRSTANAGFSSLSDLISEATIGGKKRSFSFTKTGTTGVVSGTNTLWFVGANPPAGATAAAAPGGTAWTDASTGGFPFVNPTGGDTQHLVRADIGCNLAASTILIYDRLFSVTKDMTITTAQAVTGVPTRYQSTTSTDPNYIAGNFLMFECRTALNAVAHNWTVCTYTDQANAASTLPSLTGNSSCIINRLDHPLGQWYAPLETGDTGIKALTQIQYSAVCTGAIDITIGHPIAFCPTPVASVMWVMDGINSAFNLTRVFDDACLAVLDVFKPAATASTTIGYFETVSG